MTDINEIIAKHKGKKVAVLGLGVSNMPLVRLLKTWGAEITILDRRSELPDEFLSDVTLRFSCGDGYLDRLADTGYDIIYRTPGLYPYIPQISAAVKNGAPASVNHDIASLSVRIGAVLEHLQRTAAVEARHDQKRLHRALETHAAMHQHGTRQIARLLRHGKMVTQASRQTLPFAGMERERLDERLLYNHGRSRNGQDHHYQMYHRDNE